MKSTLIIKTIIIAASLTFFSSQAFTLNADNSLTIQHSSTDINSMYITAWLKVSRPSKHINKGFYLDESKSQLKICTTYPFCDFILIENMLSEII